MYCVGNLNCFCFWQNNKKGSAAQKKTHPRTISSKVAETHCTTHPPPLPPPTPTDPPCRPHHNGRMPAPAPAPHGEQSGAAWCSDGFAEAAVLHHRRSRGGESRWPSNWEHSHVCDQLCFKRSGSSACGSFAGSCRCGGARIICVPSSSSWCVAGGQGSANQTRPTHGRIPHCPFRLACCCNPCREELAPCPQRSANTWYEAQGSANDELLVAAPITPCVMVISHQSWLPAKPNRVRRRLLDLPPMCR